MKTQNLQEQLNDKRGFQKRDVQKILQRGHLQKYYTV